ncbi:MAG: GHKL domain-containing protein [Clostridiales bacterium]|nr:GHKL domain-containing protein [Clostridiales bacterium]
MERYTQDIEKQYNELRKFRHDYQNILTSLEGYLVQEDTAGLKQYFYSNIKKHSDRLMHNEYMLEDLSNIKINGIKSIIATKIIYAQDMGLNANFETSDVITRINMDIILLVRILGILLDNAIEELLYLGYGQLLVGLIKYPDNILIIVQNTCRDNLPNIQTLKKRNFSTKSSNRGLGLSNVSDIIDQCPNVISEIIVDNQLFIHKIFIFDKEK